jgi:hypothetical protein
MLHGHILHAAVSVRKLTRLRAQACVHMIVCAC